MPSLANSEVRPAKYSRVSSVVLTTHQPHACGTDDDTVKRVLCRPFQSRTNILHIPSAHAE